MVSWMDVETLLGMSVEELKLSLQEREPLLFDGKADAKQLQAWLVELRELAVQVITQRNRWALQKEENAHAQEVHDEIDAKLEELKVFLTRYEQHVREQMTLFETARYPEPLRDVVSRLLELRWQETMIVTASSTQSPFTEAMQRVVIALKEAHQRGDKKAISSLGNDLKKLALQHEREMKPVQDKRDAEIREIRERYDRLLQELL